MKRAGGFFLATLLASSTFGQTITRSFGSVVFPGGTSATSPNITRNFGSVVFPGGSPTTPQVRTGSGLVPVAPAFNGRPGASFSGGNSFNGAGNSFRRPPANRGSRSAPATVYAYPVFVGGSSFGSPELQVAAPESAPPTQQQPNVIVVYPPQPDARPMTQVQHYREAEPEPAAQNEPEAPHYLIAFKDHTIYSSVAYWFDGDTLHYFTSGNTHNQASVELIDRPLTERLNREMGTDFKMPAVK